MVEGIVLAGGLSKRAGSNKMAFTFRNKPLILSTIETLRPFTDRIVVISGHYHDEILSFIEPLEDVECLYNEAYTEGMYTSVKKGMANTTGDVFIIPGDMPLVKPPTYEKLMKSEGLIRVPVHNKRKGHPMFIDASLRSALLDSNEYPHLKAFRNAHGFNEVTVEDEGVLIDIDTLDDYLQMKRIEERSE